MATYYPRNSGMLKYTVAAIAGSGGTYTVDVCSTAASTPPAAHNGDDLYGYFGGVLPKEPTTGQRPVYRAWFVPTAFANSASAGFVTCNVTPTWGGTNGALSALSIVILNSNSAANKTVAGTLYVELMHSIVK